MVAKVRIFFAEVDGDDDVIQGALRTIAAAAGLSATERRVIPGGLIESERARLAAGSPIAAFGAADEAEPARSVHKSSRRKKVVGGGGRRKPAAASKAPPAESSAVVSAKKPAAP